MCTRRFLLFALILGLSGCAGNSQVDIEQGVGPDPWLPEPDESLIPVVNIAPANPWPDGALPVAAPGFAVQRYADGLEHPRWLYLLPNGDVLVAESNAQPREAKGLRAWLAAKLMQRAGAGVPSADRITLLRDSDADGVAEVRSVFLQNLTSPFGMTLVGDQLYVANTDALMRFAYTPGDLQISSPGTRVVELPAGAINHHWTKNVAANPAGTKLYITVGSNSNIGENGMDAERGRAAIHEFDLASGTMRIFADGLRNPNGLAWQPHSGQLWTTVNERDEIGNDLVPDYMTSVRDGGFYGWPYSYYGDHVDPRVKPGQPQRVAAAIRPDYALGSHVAALGLHFYEDDLFPAGYLNGAFVGLHGSWNRKPRSGYKVVFVAFRNGQPVGKPQDFLTGFVVDGEAYGRPVGVIADSQGALLVADDVGNVVWRVAPAASEK